MALLYAAEIILGMVLANERRRYKVTPPLIGWAHTPNDHIWSIKSLAILLEYEPILEVYD